jgi:CheY-like chemotaxis protein
MPRNVIAIVDDLFFASKIRGTAEAVGVSASFPRHADGVKELIICDLHSQKFDVLSLAKILKADAATQTIPLIGFFSHVHVDLKRAAEEAGFDRVMTRSAFTNDLAAILTGD